MQSPSADQFGQNRPSLDVPVGVCDCCQVSPGFGRGGGGGGGGGEFRDGGDGTVGGGGAPFEQRSFLPRRRCRRGFGQPPPEPRVAQRLAGRHPEDRVPLQTVFEEVQEERVVAALQRRAPVFAARGAAGLPAPRAPPVQHGGAVGQGGDGAVTRVPFGRHKVLGPLGGVQELLTGHAQKFDDAGQLVGFVFAGKQRVPGQQLRQDAAQGPHVDGHPVPGPWRTRENL